MDDNKKYLIVGLGNAENQYAGTRHNIGFEVVSHLAETLKITFSNDRYAYVAKTHFKGRQLVLIMPTTYMNLSGNAVRYWMNQEKIAANNILVISDDLDLPVGDLRLKSKGSGGSHNGLNHIIETLGHSDFPRLRFGIGRNFAAGYQIEYVLGKFESSEKETVNTSVARASEVIKAFVTAGVQAAMQLCNTKPTPSKPNDNERNNTTPAQS